MKIIDVNNISKSFDGNVILENISFSANEGEILGLIGKNGAGKSTLMKIIVNLVKASQGCVYICGYSINEEREKALECLSVIIETPSLYEELTVKQHLKLNAYLRGIDNARLELSYKYLDFGKSLNRKISKLSLGMKQELGLAMCFMNDSQLYILDEPINGLDFDNVLKFRKTILELKSKGKTFIISSHILKELEIIADRYLFLNSGKLIEVDKEENLDIEKIYKETMYGKKII